MRCSITLILDDPSGRTVSVTDACPTRRANGQTWLIGVPLCGPGRREICRVIILGDEPVKSGRTVTAIPSCSIDVIEHTSRRHPSPEVPLVNRVIQYSLIRLLQLGERERLRHEVEGDIGITEFRPEPHSSILEHQVIQIVVEAHGLDGSPPHITAFSLSRLLPEQRDVPHNHVPVRLSKTIERVELFQIVAFVTKAFANDPAGGTVERFLSLREVLDELGSRLGEMENSNLNSAPTKAQRNDRHQQVRCCPR